MYCKMVESVWQNEIRRIRPFWNFSAILAQIPPPQPMAAAAACRCRTDGYVVVNHWQISRGVGEGSPLCGVRSERWSMMSDMNDDGIGLRPTRILISHPYIPTCRNRNTYIGRRARARTHTHTHTCTNTSILYTHTHTHTHTFLQTSILYKVRAYAHTYTHTLTQIYMYIYIYIYIYY